MSDDLEAEYAEAKAAYREALARVTKAKRALHPPKPKPVPVPDTPEQIAFREKTKAALMAWEKAKLRDDLLVARYRLRRT